MSLLPFTPATSPAAPRRTTEFEPVASSDRGIAPAAVRRPSERRVDDRAATSSAERTSRPSRDERTEGTERRDRATPPDFGALMALLAISAAREAPQARDAQRAAGTFDPSASETTASETLASEVPTMGDTDSLATGDTANASHEGESSARATTAARGLGTWSLEALRAELQRRTESRPEVMAAATAPAPSDRARLEREAADRIARALLAGDASASRAAAGGSRRAEALALAADRAQLRNASELLARGDRDAADVRTAIDAILETAGTARGRALAESMRPAFAAAVAASRADVSAPVRDAEALAPAFRARLDRVIDRMRDEFGHDVEIVETVRSSERQEHLFAQGRTRPGPVVTWTLDSAHLSGEAADVIVDGKWHNPQGYARLQAIAAEEGLHTLGMRDPGHLELRGSALPGEHAAGHAGAHQGTEASPIGTADVPGVARVAAVAQVASVASVARVATVARPGATGLARATERTGREPGTPAPSATDPLPGTASRTATIAVAGAASRRDAAGQGADDSARDRGDRGERGARAASFESLGAVGSLTPGAARVLEQGAPKVIAPVGSDAAVRAEQIATLREDAPARAVSSLTMQIDTPDGPEQVRVHLRGGVVGAEVNTASGALADRLRLQTADLQDALGRHGLESDGVRVHQSARGQDADTARLALAERGEVLKTAGASAGQSTGSEPGPKDRQPPRSAERDARDPQDDSPNQRRRDGRQEQR